MSMVEEIRDEWERDLRSNAYPQTRGLLNRRIADDELSPVGYCCLGVLCEQAARRGIVTRVVSEDGKSIGYRDPITGHTEYGWLPLAVVTWAGLDGIAPFVDSDDGYLQLSSLNDKHKLPFVTIADLVRTL